MEAKGILPRISSCWSDLDICAPASLVGTNTKLWVLGTKHDAVDDAVDAVLFSHDCARFLGCVSHRRRAVVVQLVSVPRPIVQQMPKLLQSLLGYHRFGIGVDGRDPVDVLENGDEIETYWSPDARLADEQPAYADRSRL